MFQIFLTSNFVPYFFNTFFNLFFYSSHRVLQITADPTDLGGFQWELLGTLLMGWIIVYLILRKGLHSSGKIIWFTALFPYFVMTILLFRYEKRG